MESVSLSAHEVFSPSFSGYLYSPSEKLSRLRYIQPFPSSSPSSSVHLCQVTPHFTPGLRSALLTPELCR